MIFEITVWPTAVGRRRLRPVPTVAMADPALSTVTRLADRNRRIQEQLVAAIRDAATMGHSVSAIAEAAGMSDAQVRRVIEMPRSS
jgi:hypothetical protein